MVTFKLNLTVTAAELFGKIVREYLSDVFESAVKEFVFQHSTVHLSSFHY